MRYLTAGESHGPRLTAIIEGIPAGLPLTAEDINEDLKRRQGGYGRGGRMKIESDQVVFTSGVRHGKTTGAPITMDVINKDHQKWLDIMSWARMGDFSFAFKSLFNVLRRHDIQPFLMVLIDDIHGNRSPCRLPVANARSKDNLIALNLHTTTTSVATLTAFKFFIYILCCQR